MFKAQNLLNIDRLFLLPYKLLWFIYWNLRKYVNIEAKEKNRIVMLKFMGMGSIIRIASLLESHHVDFDKITVCTFIENKEICELLGFKHRIYIRKNKLSYFIRDTFHAILAICKFNPIYIIDLERCSAAVGIFRMVCGWIAACQTISISRQKRNSIGKNDFVWSLEKRTYGEILEEIGTLLSKNQNVSTSADFYQETLVDQTKILVNINASAYLPQRKYPPSHFVDLLKLIHTRSKNTPYQFYLTGSLDEYKYVQAVVDMLQERDIQAYNVAGHWSIKELIHQLAECKLFITGDSGPMHLAVCMQIPTIVIWGPTNYRYFGYSTNAYIKHISLNKPCSPCFTDPTTKIGHACGGKISCLRELRPQWIATQLESWLHEHSSSYRKWMKPRGLILNEIQEKAVIG